MADGILTACQADFLRRAVRERQNVLIAGGTSTGKTTLANALLAEIAATGDRVLVLEDTIELQCAARDHVPLRTRAGVVSMQELVRADAPAPGSRRRRRSTRRRSPRPHQSVGNRPPRRHRHYPRRFRARRFAAPRTVDPRSRSESATGADRRGGQRRHHIAGRGRKRHVETIARVVGFDGTGYRLRTRWKRRFPN